MVSPLESLIATGTKLWLDSIDPDLIRINYGFGATGATLNPIIVSDLIKTGQFDKQMADIIKSGADDSHIAWQLTDTLVRQAQEVFLPVWEATNGNNGYVSFELDPLLEDPQGGPPHAERVARYIELGKQWSAGHRNRMIKVPATPAGLDALEELCASGVTLNVTLIFSDRQYRIARDRIWRVRSGASRLIGSRASTAFSCRGWMSTPSSMCRRFRRPPRGRSGSSTPNGFGPKIKNSGPATRRRWPRK